MFHYVSKMLSNTGDLADTDDKKDFTPSDNKKGETSEESGLNVNPSTSSLHPFDKSTLSRCPQNDPNASPQYLLSPMLHSRPPNAATVRPTVSGQKVHAQVTVNGSQLNVSTAHVLNPTKSAFSNDSSTSSIQIVGVKSPDPTLNIGQSCDDSSNFLELLGTTTESQVHSSTSEFKNENLSREVKKEKLDRQIKDFEKKRSSRRANYHRKSKRLQVGDIVTGKVGEVYKKPNGTNNLKKPVLGKIVESVADNMYLVHFLNNKELMMKSSQLCKQKDDKLYKRLTEDSTTNEVDKNVNVVDGTSNGIQLEKDVESDHDSISDIDGINDSTEDEVHKKRYSEAVAEIKMENGKSFTISSSKDQMTWTIINDHVVLQKQSTRANNRLGIRELSMQKDIADSPLPLAELFLLLSFRDGEWERALVKMNRKVEEHNTSLERKHCRDSRKCPGLVNAFEKAEFLIGIALVIGAADCSDKGEVLWSASSRGKQETEKHWETISEKNSFDKYMKLYRFKQFRSFYPKIWEEDQNMTKDPWWRFSSAVEEFNEIRRNLILPSEIIAADESMSAFRPQTSKTSNFPNISFIARKPENLGTEFKNSVCPVLGVMMFLEIQRGRNGMDRHDFFKELGATASCTVRVAKGSSHKSIDNVPEIVVADSWFGSVKAAKSLAQNGFETILQVKQNHGLFPKDKITKILKDKPGGTKVVMHGCYDGVELVATGYKYNKKAILFFISTTGAGSTVDGKPYEMKFADENGNIHIRLVPRPELVSFFFQHVNAVDIHNHLRQSSLRLEKKWITFDGYFRLSTTLIGINVVDTYRLARFHSILPRGKLKLNKDYESDYYEEDENSFTMKRFAGILSTQLLFKANEFKAHKFITDANGEIQMRVQKKGVLDNMVNKECHNFDNNMEESIGTRMKSVASCRYRNTQFTNMAIGVARKKTKRSEVEVSDVEGFSSPKGKKRMIMKVAPKSPLTLNVGSEDVVMENNCGNLIDTNVMFWKGDENDNKQHANRSISSASCSIIEDDRNDAIECYQDVHGNTHTVMKLDRTVSTGKKTKGKTYALARKCQLCGNRARTFCYECDKVYCYPLRKNILTGDSCFVQHMKRHRLTKKRLVKSATSKQKRV